MNDLKIWIRGEICEPQDALVPVLSATAQFGINVFEGIRAYYNEETDKIYLFRAVDHLKRLSQSSHLAQLPLDYDHETIISTMRKLILVNRLSGCDVAFRVTLFGDGIGSWHETENTNMFIKPTIQPRRNIESLPSLTASVSSWARINDNCMPPRIKLGANYANSRYAYLSAKHAGFDVPIFLDDNGKVSESSGACIFLIRDSRLITPNVSSSILESITRDTILQIAQELSLIVEERIVDRTELYLAEELFLVGTAVEILPIVQVDEYKIGDGKAGKVTLKLLQEYHETVTRKAREFNNWCIEL